MDPDPGPGRTEGTEVVVRRLRQDEVREYRWIRLQALATDPTAFGSTYLQEAGFPAAVWEERTISGATGANRGTWVAIAPDGQWVGIVGAVSDPAGLAVVSMWVDPRHRGRRIGARLLDTLLEWARERQPEAPIHLSVNPAQLDAVRLYESRGFVRTGETEPLRHTPTVRLDVMLRRRAGPAPGTS